MQFLVNSTPSDRDTFLKSLSEEQNNILSQINDDLCLAIGEEGRLSLSWKDYSALQINAKRDLDYHKKFFFKNSPYKEPLARAIGLKKGKPRPSVIDATGGMLGDSLLMFALGIDDLCIFERNPVLAMLILDVMKHDNLHFKFYHGQVLDFDINASVIYFDPMYHEKNSKAAPKKNMAIFRELIGADHDAFEVAKKLLEKKCERVVIKRSRKAAPLIENPHHSIEGKSTCYDVYLCSN